MIKDDTLVRTVGSDHAFDSLTYLIMAIFGSIGQSGKMSLDQSTWPSLNVGTKRVCAYTQNGGGDQVEQPQLALDALGHNENDEEGNGEDGEEDPKSGLSSVVNVDEVGRRVGTRRALRVGNGKGGMRRLPMVMSVGMPRTFGDGDRARRVVRVGDGEGRGNGVEELHID